MTPPAAPAPPPRRRLVLLLLLLAGAAAYAPALAGPFLFDDDLFIVKNGLIRSDAPLAAFFSGGATAGAFVGPDNFYRPLQSCAFALLHRAFGLTPWPFHAVGLLFHVGAAFLLYLLLLNLRLSAAGALAGAGFFLLHPVQTEAVAYISGLSDPMAFFFMLSGLLLFTASWTEDRRAVPRQAGALACAVLALLAKESAVAFPLLAGALFLYARRFPDPPPVRWQAGFFTAAFALAGTYVVLKLTALSFTGHAGLTGEANVYTEHLWVRVVTFLHALPAYARLILWPGALFYEKPYVAYTTLADPAGILGLFLAVSAGAAAALSWKRNRVLLLGLAWFFVALGPVSGVIPMNAIFLEHWLYVPMAGLAFLAGTAWPAWGWKEWRKRKPALFLMLAVAGAAGLRTNLRCREWADPIRFFENELRHGASARMHNNLAMHLMDARRVDEAIFHYQAAIRLRDDYPQTRHNLAKAYMEKGDALAAAWEYREALRRDPGFAYSYDALAKLFRARDMEPQAVKMDEWLRRVLAGGRVTPEEIETFFRGLPRPAPSRK